MPTETKLKPAPDAKRCQAGTCDGMFPDGTCGAGQPLYETDGLIHCEHHASWCASEEGLIAAAAKQIKSKK